MKTTYLACFGGVLLATLVACGDDTGGTSTTGAGATGNTGNTGNSSSGGSGGDGNSSSGGSGGDGNSSSGGTGTGGEGEGGGSGGGGNAQAEAFCGDFDDFCGFGTGYADLPACIAAFNGYDAARQACVVTHVGYAETEPDPHCAHAAGAAPCN